MPHVDVSQASEPPAPDAGLSQDLIALASEARLDLLPFLTRPRYAEEISERLGMVRQSAIRHVETLEARGFVRRMHGRRASGPVVEFQVVPSRLFATGVAVARLGGLVPEGGPLARGHDRTLRLDADPSQPPLPSESLSSLRVVDGPQAGARHELGAGGARSFSIGREAGNDLSLSHDPFVSGRHARIDVAGKGHVLVDLSSANGTTLNHVRIPAASPVPLRVGDLVGVGRSWLVYQQA